MKKIIIACGLLLASSQLVSANHPSINISYRNSIKKNIDVSGFTGVAAGGPLTVIVTLGSTEGIRFEGDKEAIVTLVTEVKNRILIIRPQTSWTSWAHKYEGKKIVAYVSAKSLNSLTMSGDGSITVKGKIDGSSLTTTLSGSGKINASADVDSYVGVISGSGNLNITGSAENSTVTISGSGKFSQKSFSTSNLQAVISGSGSVNMNVDDAINAVITGSGSVYYTGNAEVSQRRVGSGSVKKAG